MKRLLPIAILAVAAASPGAADASSSALFETEGGSVRLVTSGLPAPDGTLRGALVVDLGPGWKTYWRDPGSSGVPPQIDLAGSRNASGATLHFPAPQWHRDDYGAWAGYDRSVSFPVSITVPEPDRFSEIKAAVFLGICRTICVPVSAELVVEPGSDPDDEHDRVIVENAFAELPGRADDGFAVVDAEVRGDILAVSVVGPGDLDRIQLFAAAAGGYALGVPAPPRIVEGRAVFDVPILDAPRDGAAGVIPYTLVSGERAVSGEFRLP